MYLETETCSVIEGKESWPYIERCRELSHWIVSDYVTDEVLEELKNVITSDPMRLCNRHKEELIYAYPDVEVEIHEP